MRALFNVIVINFSDGTLQTVDIPMNPLGGADFVGFTDADKPISVVTLNFPQDVVGVDDVRFGSSQATVPEPSTLIIWSVLGGVGLAVNRWRKRKAA